MNQKNKIRLYKNIINIYIFINIYIYIKNHIIKTKFFFLTFF